MSTLVKALDRQKATSHLIIASFLCLFLAGCLSPQYPRAQQLLADLQQQGLQFKADSPPAVLGVSPLFPPELYPLLFFVYVRPRKGASGPPDTCTFISPKP